MILSDAEQPWLTHSDKEKIISLNKFNYLYIVCDGTSGRGSEKPARRGAGTL